MRATLKTLTRTAVLCISLFAAWWILKWLALSDSDGIRIMATAPIFVTHKFSAKLLEAFDSSNEVINTMNVGVGKCTEERSPGLMCHIARWVVYGMGEAMRYAAYPFYVVTRGYKEMMGSIWRELDEKMLAMYPEWRLRMPRIN